MVDAAFGYSQNGGKFLKICVVMAFSCQGNLFQLVGQCFETPLFSDFFNGGKLPCACKNGFVDVGIDAVALSVCPVAETASYDEVFHLKTCVYGVGKNEKIGNFSDTNCTKSALVKRNSR